MRINYTVFSTSLTGGVRVMLEIANKLVDRGHEVTITSLGTQADHRWYPLKANANCVYRTRSRKLLDTGIRYGLSKFLGMNLYPYFEIERLTKAIVECDINVATLCFTAFSVFKSDKGIPFYHMQHYEPLFFNDRYLKKLAEGSYHLPLNRITNSIWLRNQMKEKYGYDPPIVNPAIDHSIFYPREVEKSTDKFRILCFGKQTRWKGFPEALKAMRIVMKKRNDIEFIAFGTRKPSYQSDVHYEFANSLSDDELAGLYASSDVMICPSWYESFPLFPLEAMACGTPIVTTPYGTEDYAFHERNCLIVPPRNPKTMADAVIRLLEDENLREKFRREGQKTAKEFTWDKTVDGVERLFKSALK